MSQDVVDAKERELMSLISNDVLEVVPFENQVRVSYRVISEKYKDSGKKIKADATLTKWKIKARLVAYSFEENIINLWKDSSTFSRACLQLVFLMASTMGWQLQTIDQTKAFLQGSFLKREVLLCPCVCKF